MMNSTFAFVADYGELSRHEEHIVHHSGSRGQKSVRLHRQGRQNRKALLSRVQGGFHCKSILVTPLSVSVTCRTGGSRHEESASIVARDSCFTPLPCCAWLALHDSCFTRKNQNRKTVCSVQGSYFRHQFHISFPFNSSMRRNERVIAFGGQISVGRSMGCKL